MNIETKQAIRKRVLTLLKNQKEADRFNKSRKILDKLFATPEFQRAHIVLFYASLKEEVETFEMMKQAQLLGKQIALPLIIKDQKEMVPSRIDNLIDDLAAGPYGIPQPKSGRGHPIGVDQLDLVIVPGIAFDRDKNRLGRGGGYYDRFLARLSTDTPTIGLAFDFQIVDHLPFCAEHDLPVSRVIVN